MHVGSSLLDIKPTLTWTGERFLPSIGGSIELEHMHRYIMAREFVRNKKVLDIACGEGYGSNFLAEGAEHVFGVDISLEAIDFARNKYIKPNLEFIMGSCSNIPLPDHCVDVVISFETIEHHAEHEKMMLEIRRVLHPNGILIISSPDKHEYSDVPQYNNSFHIKELYQYQFEALLASHFVNHMILGQRVTYGSNIANLQKDREHEYTTYWGSSDNIQKQRGINKPLYFIAIATDGDLPKTQNSFFEGAQGDLKAKDDFIGQLTVSLQEATQQLNDMILSLQNKEQQLSHQSTMLQNHEATIIHLNQSISELYASNSWHITAPLRALGRIFKTTINKITQNRPI